MAGLMSTSEKAATQNVAMLADYLNVFRPSGHGPYSAPEGSTFTIHSSGALIINDPLGVQLVAFAPGQWHTVNAP